MSRKNELSSTFKCTVRAFEWFLSRMVIYVRFYEMGPIGSIIAHVTNIFKLVRIRSRHKWTSFAMIYYFTGEISVVLFAMLTTIKIVVIVFWSIKKSLLRSYYDRWYILPILSVQIWKKILQFKVYIIIINIKLVTVKLIRLSLKMKWNH